MTAVPLSQPYIPKTMGHMVWVCGTAVAGLGTLRQSSLKNKDLASLFGTVLGTASLVFVVFQVSQAIEAIKSVGTPGVFAGKRRGATSCRGKNLSDFRQRATRVLAARGCSVLETTEFTAVLTDGARGEEAQ
jgi:hypothetical protein